MRLTGLPFLLAATSIMAAESRLPWTTSRIEGSPDPAKPFVAEQVLPQLRLNEALDLATVPGTDRLLVVERRGRIASFPTRSGEPALDVVLDLRALHPRAENAYSVVLHPRYRETREIFVCYTFPEGQKDGTRVSRFKLSSLEPLRADPATEEIVITWLSGGHNGCSLQFGPDGFLYISTGDSGPAAPPDLHNTGQDVSDLSGGILRIDVDQREGEKRYAIPGDNPWVGRDGIRPELWAYGLRNPWRMSFDPATGNLWCGDIGWEIWEMVHLIKRGANYGWSAYEASQPIKPQLLNLLAPVTPPIVVHPHAEAASITGGYVYHGKQYPELTGAYVYGDYATGKIWALWHDGTQIVRHEEIADTPHAIVGFGQDDRGELFYLHYSGTGTLHRLVRNAQVSQVAGFPRRLSETGLFAETRLQTPAAGVYSFEPGMPMWQDGAIASRWIAFRDTTALETTVRQRARRGAETKEYTTRWPAGAVLARTLSLGALATHAADRTRPVETQVLHYNGEAWNAYSYRWDDEGRDAELVEAAGAEKIMRVAADPHALGERTREYSWRFASRAECLRCHSTWHNGALGFTALQLGSANETPLKRLHALGLVNDNFLSQANELRPPLRNAETAARAVLHANCAACHTAHAGGSVSIFLNAETPTEKMNIVGVSPTQGGLGLAHPKLVDAGNAANSVLALRMAKLGAGHMPLIGSRDVDVAGLKIVEDWIAGLPPADSAERRGPGDLLPAGGNVTEMLQRELATVEGAMRVRRAVDDGRLSRSQLEAASGLAWASPHATVRDLFERFKPDGQRERLLGANVDASAVLAMSGDVARGARLLASEGKLGSCQACHVIQGQGRHFGPELSRLGAQYPREKILESLLEPSKTIAPLYRTTILKLRDGSTLAGFVRARGASELVLAMGSGQILKPKLSDITSEETQSVSLMPEGLLQGVTAQEAADVVAYLSSLK